MIGHREERVDSAIAAAFAPAAKRTALGDVPAAAPTERLGEKNLNPASIGFWELIREDLRTHDNDLFAQGFWAVAVHRFGNWRMSIKPKLLRAPFSLLYKILYKFVEWTCGISLGYSTKLGRRVHIWHHGGTILSARSIGNDVHIRQNTTFGIRRRNDDVSLRPVIEDRVDIGVGAVVVGPITVGHDAQIGANAVVLEDVPPYAVVVGVPARVVRIASPLKLGIEPGEGV